ncbi:hypothetical protein KK083_19130 [Fulvivirgaceae bacterium PWU4]|uniref:Uncharacterized protein n=1 Tax=Chryseosolibacter histidini TaxID=2782349 RepID=A0AAP2DMC5_9BACT|nr:hypothetical protein [Chryseosolibacter histidini]MBT1699016.1 hypothetical protein [Chryseosolibacter histidini]
MIIKNNPLTKGASGMLGDVIVFRQLRGKTIVANKPRRPCSESAHQRENRLRFRAASTFAKRVLQDPDKKAYYVAKARKLKLPNAYTAAITDYMRKPAITAVKCKDVSHGRMTITAGKAGFSLASVTVTLMNAEGRAVGTGAAVLKDRQKNEWTVRLGDGVSSEGGTSPSGLRVLKGSGDRECVCRMMVTVRDWVGNWVNTPIEVGAGTSPIVACAA